MAAVSAVDFVSYPTRDDDPWRAQSGWRLGRVNQPAAWMRGRTHRATVTADLGGDGVIVDTDGHQLHVESLLTDEIRRRVRVDGRAATVWDHHDERVVEWDGHSYRLQRSPPLTIAATAGDRGTGSGAGRLTAPMPARVVKIVVAVGQRVIDNQPLIILEAMKMEHVVEAPHAGLVTELCVEVGDQVASGAQLLTLGDADRKVE